VALSAPAANALVRGTATTVSATASDASGVAGVQFLLDGANLGAEDTTSPYSITWNSTTAADGPHLLSARARDTAGNVAVSAARTVTVDNALPSGTVVINGGAAATNSRNATLTLSASDATTSVTQMRFSNTGTSWSAAEAYATTKAWTLSTGAGTKTVYAQFMDAAGNWSTSATDTIVLDTTAPTISAVATAPAGTGARQVTWTTNEPATSQVEYGPTTAYGTLSPLDPALVTAHSVTLTGLASGSYNFRVRSRDAAANERLGTNGTFTVTGPDLTPPSAPASATATVQSPSQVLVSWPASTDNVAVAGYRVFRDGLLVGSPTATSFLDTGVLRGTTYAYLVRAFDAAGNVSADSPTATVTTPVLLITAIAASTTTTTATITWTTDVPATSEVEWGTTTAYGFTTGENPTLTTSHAMTLTGLTAGTLHHFRVVSADVSAAHAFSADATFTTTSTSTTGTFLNEILISGMNLPTAVKFLPDGDMLIVELGGHIWLVPAGTTQVDPVPFLTLTNIGTLNGQQGLMDMVLDPGFLTNHQYYVFYTLGTPNRDRVSRFTATPDHTGTVPGSELVIYQDALDANVEHHGGALNFGNDGKLYITTGEHFDPGWSQLLSSPRGKILRINPDGTVPTDNPFYDGAGPNYDAVWALGLRNPYRASYDAPTGRLYVGDVGGNDNANSIEELDVGAAGANFGWPNCEGTSCGSNPAYTSPIYSYPHAGRDAAITAGFVYRGSQFPAEYYGSFFFADYAQNWIRRLTLDASGNVTGVFNFEPPDGSADGPYGDIVYLEQGPDGALYYVDLGYSDTTGQVGVSKIRRIRFVASNQPPTAVATATPVSGLAPLTVSFSSAGSADPEGQPITYLWTFGDNATSTEANPVHVYTLNGPYAARLTVSDGNTGTLSAPINIDVGNRPVPTITSPVNGALFRAGDVLTVSGDATDIEDGILPAAAFAWNIDFLHEGHVHPGLPQVGTKSFTFPIATFGHDYSGNSRFRITLTVTDSTGLQASQVVLVYPDKVNLSFDTVPAGLSLSIDGIPHTTPLVYDTLKGFQHTIAAPDQAAGASSYTFASWSDGGAQSHLITVPNANASYAATYSVAQIPVPPGLVGGWRLDEGAGTSTADVSGNGITGTLVGGPAWSAGVRGNALTFAGTTQYVNLGNPAALQLTGSMTLSAWIRISSNPGDDGAIVAKLGGAGWQLKTSPDTGVRTAAIQISSNGSDSIQRYSSTVLQAGTWYHLAGVFDAAARTLSVYVNGVLDNGVLSGTVPAAQWNDPEAVNIAQRAGFPGTFNFLGAIDEVHVFNRALSAAEIQTDMNTPR
jgi:glucose/arabinose dehydrogenase/PKD repeat protein